MQLEDYIVLSFDSMSSSPLIHWWRITSDVISSLGDDSRSTLALPSLVSAARIVEGVFLEMSRSTVSSVDKMARLLGEGAGRGRKAKADKMMNL